MNRITGHVVYPAGKVKPRLALMTPPGIPGALLRILAEAAEAGAACPSGQDIADRLNLPDARTALRMLRGLRDAGWIEMDSAVGRLPVVTVRDTGKSTRRPSSDRAPTDRDGLKPNEKRTYDLLAAAASAGSACPSNKEISERLGYASPNTASTMVSHLEGLGLISVQRGRCHRVVTITASGAATASPALSRQPSGNSGRLAGGAQ